MSRALQHELHSYLELAAQVLDLSLTGGDLERLAVELTPAVKALIVEATEAHAETVPISYGVVDEQAGVHTTRYAGCTARIGVDIDVESPAASLAAKLRTAQPDIVATTVPAPTYLWLVVRPQTRLAWTAWLERLHVAEGAVTTQDNAAYATGTVGDVAVELQGLEVPMLLVDESAARLMSFLAESGEAPV